MSALGTEVRADLVDRMIELYCEWRTSCGEVAAAYGRFVDASSSGRGVAFGAYMAALDREQAACETYAEVVRVIVAQFNAHESRTRRRERRGRRR